MIAPFDIFQMESAGSVVWRGAAATLEEARTRVRELSATSPAEYFILSQRTGHKITLRSAGAGQEELAG
jgi:sarcosine oxidase gamma subunit